MKGVLEGGGGSSCRFRGAESPRFYVGGRERGAGSQQEMNFGMGLCVRVVGGWGVCHLLKMVERTAKIIQTIERVSPLTLLTFVGSFCF